MDVRVFDDLAALGRCAAEPVIAAIQARPDAVIGLATGSSPLPVYEAWAELARERELDLSRVRAFALDEYADLDPAHPESYRSVITETVVHPVGLTPALVHVPDSAATPESAHAFDSAIAAAGGIDVQILGIGRNGHLGFNEPGTAFDSRTHRVSLMPETIADNARFFGAIENVPTEAITQGLGTIMEARRLVIVATGEAKAEAVAAAIDGPLTERVPASVVRQHSEVMYVLDRAAASLLKRSA